MSPKATISAEHGRMGKGRETTFLRNQHSQNNSKKTVLCSCWQPSHNSNSSREWFSARNGQHTRIFQLLSTSHSPASSPTSSLSHVPKLKFLNKPLKKTLENVHHGSCCLCSEHSDYKNSAWKNFQSGNKQLVGVVVTNYTKMTRLEHCLKSPLKQDIATPHPERETPFSSIPKEKILQKYRSCLPCSGEAHRSFWKDT